MEETKNQGGMEGKTCSCGMNCACNGGGFRRGRGIGMLLRLLIGLIILIAVFAIGVKVGEFKTAFQSSWGGGRSGMMMRGGAGGGMHMMMGGAPAATSSTSTQ